MIELDYIEDKDLQDTDFVDGQEFEIILRSWYRETSFNVKMVNEHGKSFLKVYDHEVLKLNSMVIEPELFAYFGQILFMIDGYDKFHLLKHLKVNVTVLSCSEPKEELYKVLYYDYNLYKKV